MMGGAACTALRGLDDTLRLERGESLLVFGASGGVGHTAVQLARRMGARVFAVASGADGVALVEQLGADAVVNGHDRGVAAALLVDAPELVAVEARHLEIEHDQADARVRHVLQRGGAVDGRDNLVAITVEQHAQDASDVRVVVDDKHDRLPGRSSKHHRATSVAQATRSGGIPVSRLRSTVSSSSCSRSRMSSTSCASTRLYSTSFARSSRNAFRTAAARFVPCIVFPSPSTSRATASRE